MRPIKIIRCCRLSLQQTFLSSYLILFLKLLHAPPLYTSVKPFDLKIRLATPLLEPDSQQVMIGLFLFFSFLRFRFSWSTEILTDPRMCPLANSPFVRTSKIIAPRETNSGNSTFGPSPNNVLTIPIINNKF